MPARDQLSEGRPDRFVQMPGKISAQVMLRNQFYHVSEVLVSAAQIRLTAGDF